MDGALELLVSLMRRGGPVMWPIALCSVATVLVTVRKALQWLFFALQVRVGARGWAAAVGILRERGREAAAEAVRGAHSPYAGVLAAALAHEGVPFPEALEAEGARLARRLGFGLGALDTIVTLAPMLGILGTVTGIITSFDLMGAMGVDDPTGVAAGIAEALITTAAGLVVSMAALLPLNVGRVCHRALVRRLEAALSLAECAAEGKWPREGR